MSVDLDTLARRYARGVRELDADVLRAVLAAYREAETVIVAEFEQLDARVRELHDAGLDVDAKTLAELDEYRRLVQTIRNAVAEYAARVDALVQASIPQALALAAEHARAAGIELAFAPHHPDAFVAMTAAVDPASPLTRLLRERASESFAGAEAERALATARRALLTAVAAGWHPTTAARLLREALALSAYRAQRLARTEILRAYRAGTLELYRQSATVTGWRWVASLSPRTCAACLAMHGRVFDLDRTVFDHPNGRCVVVPVTEYGDEARASDTLPDAWSWFWAQSFAVRDRMLGPALHEALRRGYASYESLRKIERTPLGYTLRAVPASLAATVSVRKLLELARRRQGLSVPERELLERADAVAGFLERAAGVGVVARRATVHGLGWSGDVVWREGPYIAAFDPRSRAILVSPSRLRLDEPLSTHALVHELLHAASATGKAGFDWRELPHEEAWAEAYARVLVRRLAREQVTFRWLDIAALERAWERHPYHALVTVMEEARELAGMQEAERF